MNNKDLVLSGFTAIASLIGFIFIYMLLEGNVLEKIDQSVYIYFQNFKDTGLYVFFKYFTNLSGETISVGVFSVVIYILYKKHNLQEIVFLILFVAFSISLTMILKYTLMIERPDNHISGLSGYSFPSGHTVLSIVLAFLVYRLVKNFKLSFGNEKLFILCLMLYVFVSLIARIFISAHWFSDILGGLFLGLYCLSFSYFIFIKKRT